MGAYNILMIYCPHCNKEIDVQSAAGNYKARIVNTETEKCQFDDEVCTTYRLKLILGFLFGDETMKDIINEVDSKGFFNQTRRDWDKHPLSIEIERVDKRPRLSKLIVEPDEK